MTFQSDATALAKQAQDVFSRNIDTLVAGFLIRHPDIDPSTVRINMQMTPNGATAFVTPVQIPIPSQRVVEGWPSPADGGSRAYAFGFNACREELIRSLAAMQEPPMEADDAS